MKYLILLLAVILSSCTNVEFEKESFNFKRQNVISQIHYNNQINGVCIRQDLIVDSQLAYSKVYFLKSDSSIDIDYRIEDPIYHTKSVSHNTIKFKQHFEVKEADDHRILIISGICMGDDDIRESNQSIFKFDTKQFKNTQWHQLSQNFDNVSNGEYLYSYEKSTFGMEKEINSSDGARVVSPFIVHKNFTMTR